MSDNYFDDVVSENQDQDSIEDSIEQNNEENRVVAEAMKRIEQANLYNTLLKHDLFAPNSARQEILIKVQNEIRSFILERLEILLGIKSEKPTAQESQVFSDLEIDALKSLANRVITKSQNPTNSQFSPSIVPIKASESSHVNQVTYNHEVQPNEAKPTQTKPLQTKKIVSKKANKGYAQSVSMDIKPVKMPSQEMINQANAMQAARSGNGDLANINSTIANIFLKK